MKKIAKAVSLKKPVSWEQGLKDWFAEYEEADEPGKMGGEGIETLFEEMGVSMEGVRDFPLRGVLLEADAAIALRRSSPSSSPGRSNRSPEPLARTSSPTSSLHSASPSAFRYRKVPGADRLTLSQGLLEFDAQSLSHVYRKGSLPFSSHARQQASLASRLPRVLSLHFHVRQGGGAEEPRRRDRHRALGDHPRAEIHDCEGVCRVRYRESLAVFGGEPY